MEQDAIGNASLGSLYEGKVIVDKTFGHAAYGCVICCGFNADGFMSPDPFTVETSFSGPIDATGTDGCSGSAVVLDPYMTSWTSDNTSIATASYAQGTGVSPGAPPNLWSSGYIHQAGIRHCPDTFVQNEGPTTVDPSVTITAPAGIPVGQAVGNFQVNIGSNPQGMTITLTLSTTSGTGDATYNSGGHQTTLLGSATVPVSGTTVSSTANNLKMQATDPNNHVLATANFTVVWVTLALRTGTGLAPSQYNSADGAYQQQFSTNALGPFTNNTLGGCFTGAEFVGTVQPSNYTGMVVLRRTVLATAVFTNSSLYGQSTTPANDTSDATLRDDNPHSSNGASYDLDAPGILPHSGTVVWRARENFSEYAVLDSANNNTTASNPLTWFSAVSCSTPDFQNYSLATDVSGDNQAGTGSVNLTWDLSHP